MVSRGAIRRSMFASVCLVVGWLMGGTAVGFLYGEASAVEYRCWELGVWSGTGGADVRVDGSDGIYKSNLWNGEAGGDSLYGENCADVDLVGKDGQDRLYPGVSDPDNAADTAHGGVGSDSLDGQEGEDELYGDGSNDFLYDNTPTDANDTDHLHGGDGADTIKLIDGDPNDTANGGPGTNDTCEANPGDVKIGCES